MNCTAIFRSAAEFLFGYIWDGGSDSNTTIIRIVAGVLAVIILVILIQRRRTRVK